MLGVYRFGSYLPTPGVDSQRLSDLLSGQTGVISLLTLFSGGGLQRLSLFALGIMPYITASIILQVLTPVFPNLQQLQKEGELGQRKITQYTRYLTVALPAIQAAGYTYLFSKGSGSIGGSGGNGALIQVSVRNVVLIIVTLTAGTTLLMWIGELITQRGIGNGISLLIFASILASAPLASRPGGTARPSRDSRCRWSCSASSARSCTCRRASARSRSSTPSGWSAGA